MLRDDAPDLETQLTREQDQRLRGYAAGDDRWGWQSVKHSDVAELLAAYDAIHAERDELRQDVRDLCKEIQEERAETTPAMIGWQHKAEAAAAAQAQAAPVLAALRQAVVAHQAHVCCETLLEELGAHLTGLESRGIR